MSSRSQALVHRNKIDLKIIWYGWIDNTLPLRKKSNSLSHFWECLCLPRSNWSTQISGLVLSPSGTETAVIRQGHKRQGVSFGLAFAPGKENQINQHSLTKKRHFLGL